MEETKKETFIKLEWPDDIDNDDPDTDFELTDVEVTDDYSPRYSVTYPSSPDGELALGSYLDHVYENNNPYAGKCSGCGGDGCEACSFNLED